MRTRIHITSELILVLCLYLFFVCVPDAQSAARAVRVGIFQNAPMVFKDKVGHPEGIYVDLLNAIAAEEEWEVTYIEYSWAKLLTAGKNGNIDLLTSIAFSEDRAQYLDYSKEVVLSMWGQVYTGEDVVARNMLDLNGKKVAILSHGINGANFIRVSNSFNVRCRIVEKASYDEVMLAVETGEVDAGILNNIKGHHLEKVYKVKRTPIIFSAINVYFAAPRGQTELLETIDKYMAEWRKDDTSVYHQILRRWTGEYGERLDPSSPFFKSAWVVVAALLAGVVTFIFIERRKAD